MKSRTGPRIMTTVAVVTLVASIIGFVVTLMLNTFVFDEYDTYGEVPIPGSASLHLPAGDVTVSFHTQLIGSTTGNGLPVPSLKYRIASSGHRQAARSWSWSRITAARRPSTTMPGPDRISARAD